MKAKIVWMTEYADDNFSQHIAVDSGDWEEVTEEECDILYRWSSYMKGERFAKEYPVVIRQDRLPISQRILECRKAAAKHEAHMKNMQEAAEKKRKEKEARKKEKEREEFERLKQKFGGNKK